MSDGNCDGLAKACFLLDETKVNRILLDNCGIDGKKFAKILKGLETLPDFKSIIYKHNEFNEESLQALIPFFKKKMPFHLEELKLIDLKT